MLGRGIKAIDLCKRRDYSRSEKGLRSLNEARFEIPSTHCHLARVLILTGREAKAREHIAQAWTNRDEGLAYVIPRILFFQLAFTLLDETELSL
jgi:superfamily II DNA/RNA helicase